MATEFINLIILCGFIGIMINLKLIFGDFSLVGQLFLESINRKQIPFYSLLGLYVFSMLVIGAPEVAKIVVYFFIFYIYLLIYSAIISIYIQTVIWIVQYGLVLEGAQWRNR